MTIWQIQPHQRPPRLKQIRSALWSLLAILAVCPAQAKDIHFGDLVLSNPRVYGANSAPDGMVGLLGIRSNNLAGDTLTGVSIEKSVAKKAEIQRIVFKDGVRKVVPVAVLEIEPGSTLELKPGRIQLAFIGMTKRLQSGSTLEAELTFRNAGAIVIEFVVETRPTPSRKAIQNDMR